MPQISSTVNISATNYSSASDFNGSDSSDQLISNEERYQFPPLKTIINMGVVKKCALIKMVPETFTATKE